MNSFFFLRGVRGTMEGGGGGLRGKEGWRLKTEGKFLCTCETAKNPKAWLHQN